MRILMVVVGLIAAQPALGQNPPVCHAGGPYSGQVGQLVQFDGTGSSAPGGFIVLYEWSFGDGGTAQGATPEHGYQSAGAYSVTLRVTDNLGSFSECNAEVEIGPVAVEPSTWGRIKRILVTLDMAEERILCVSNDGINLGPHRLFRRAHCVVPALRLGD